MRRSVSALLSCFALFAAGSVARADTTNFTLYHGDDVFQFSIDGSTPISYFNDGTLDNQEEFSFDVPLTLNGRPVPAQKEGVENLYQFGTGAQLFVEYLSGNVNGSPQYTDIFEFGNPIYTKVNGAPIFTPGTYFFPEADVYTYTLAGPNQATGTDTYLDDRVVVSQGSLPSSPVPEPSTFCLIGSAVLGSAGLLRRRLKQV